MNKIFNTSEIDDYRKIFDLLGLKETRRKSIPLSHMSLVTYEKEKDVPNYEALKDRYMPRSTIPFFVVIILVIIVIALATAYLIINFTTKGEVKLVYFFSLMMPTSLLTLLATGISFYRYFVELKNVERRAAVLLLEKEVNKNEK